MVVWGLKEVPMLWDLKIRLSFSDKSFTYGIVMCPLDLSSPFLVVFFGLVGCCCLDVICRFTFWMVHVGYPHVFKAFLTRGGVSVVMIDKKIAGKGVILLHGCGPVGPAHRVSYANERVDLNFSQIADKKHGKGYFVSWPRAP